MYPRILSKVSTWVENHGSCGVELEELDERILAKNWCWDDSFFRRVCVSILSRFSSNVSEEVVVLGKIIDALGPNVPVVSVHGGHHAIVEAFVRYLGSG